MRLLLDTNIIVDVLSERGGYVDSLRVIERCRTGRAEGFGTPGTVCRTPQPTAAGTNRDIATL